MSTKIYNGSYIETTSTKKLKIFISKLSSALEEKKKELIYKHIASDFIKTYDKIYLSEEEKEKKQAISSLFSFEEKDRNIEKWNNTSLISFIDRMIAKRHTDVYKTMQRDPSCDYGFTVAFIPFKNKILTIPYYEQEEFGNIFFEMDEVFEYGYWNNTDKPDDITNREWKKREKDWDEALGYKAPSDVGFSWKFGRDSIFRFLNFQDHNLYENIMSHFPSFEERVEKNSRSLVHQRKSKELYEPYKQEGKNQFQFIFDADKYINSEEGLNDIKKEKERIRFILKQEFFIEDLKIEIKDLIL